MFDENSFEKKFVKISLITGNLSTNKNLFEISATLLGIQISTGTFTSSRRPFVKTRVITGNLTTNMNLNEISATYLGISSLTWTLTSSRRGPIPVLLEATCSRSIFSSVDSDYPSDLLPGFDETTIDLSENLQKSFVNNYGTRA